jgi:hypothetical protein
MRINKIQPMDTATKTKTPAVGTARGEGKTNASNTVKTAGLCSARQAYRLAREAYMSDPPEDPNMQLEQLGHLETMRRAAWGKARR